MTDEWTPAVDGAVLLQERVERNRRLVFALLLTTLAILIGLTILLIVQLGRDAGQDAQIKRIEVENHPCLSRSFDRQDCVDVLTGLNRVIEQPFACDVIEKAGLSSERCAPAKRPNEKGRQEPQDGRSGRPSPTPSPSSPNGGTDGSAPPSDPAPPNPPGGGGPPPGPSPPGPGPNPPGSPGGGGDICIRNPLALICLQGVPELDVPGDLQLPDALGGVLTNAIAAVIVAE